jgi:hypothetical protein
MLFIFKLSESTPDKSGYRTSSYWDSVVRANVWYRLVGISSGNQALTGWAFATTNHG